MGHVGLFCGVGFCWVVGWSGDSGMVVAWLWWVWCGLWVLVGV